MTHAVPEARRRGRPPKINRERIVEAAFELGIENLTMAAVAARLGVSHQSLYGWVRDRDELVDLMSDQLIADVEANLQLGGESWRTSLRRLADGLVGIARRHPGFAAAALVRYRTGPGHLRLNDRVVRRLVAAGFEPVQGQQIYETVGTAVMGWQTREEAIEPLRVEMAPVAMAVDGAVVNGLVGQATATAVTAVLFLASDRRYLHFIEALVEGLPDPALDIRMSKPDDLVDTREMPAALARG